MIQPQTYLTVADNTGARKIMCIRILGNNKQYGNIGDVIIGVVKVAAPNMPIKRSDVVRAVIVRTRHTLRRKDGMRDCRSRVADLSITTTQLPSSLTLLLLLAAYGEIIVAAFFDRRWLTLGKQKATVYFVYFANCLAFARLNFSNLNSIDLHGLFLLFSSYQNIVAIAIQLLKFPDT